MRCPGFFLVKYKKDLPVCMSGQNELPFKQTAIAYRGFESYYRHRSKMFIYENGIVVDYIRDMPHTDPEINRAVVEHMLEWHRTLPGQVKVRLGKVGLMQGQEPNMKRLDNE